MFPCEITDIYRFRHLQQELTKLETVERIDERSSNIRFSCPRMSNDSVVVRAALLDIWANLSTNPVLLKYAGSELILNNFKLNCTKGIEPPSRDAVFDNCLTKDYGDPRLLHWVAHSNQPEHPQPRVIETRSFTVVNCVFNNISIVNETYQCPPYNIKLPYLQPFETGSVSHMVEITRINSTVGYDCIFSQTL